MGQFYLGNTELNQLWLGNTKINKAKGPVTIANSETRNWINATGISNPNIWVAVDQFVSGLKTDNVWSKFYAIYPLITDDIPNADTQFKINLVNSSRYTLGYINPGTYGYDGYTNGGVNSYINTNLNLSGSASTGLIPGGDTLHLSFYTADNFTNDEQGHIGAFWKRQVGVATLTDGMGIFTTGSTQACCQFFGGGPSTSFLTVGAGNPLQFPVGTDEMITTNATSSGWFVGTTGVTGFGNYLNGNVLSFTGNVNDAGVADVDTPILLGSVGMRQRDPDDYFWPFEYSTRKYSFFTIGAHLDASEVANANTRIQTLQQQIDAIFGTSRAV